MLKLIKLELRRTNLRAYIVASLAIFLCNSLIMFGGISSNQIMTANLLTTSSNLGVLLTLCFSVLGAVMYGRLMITEYSGKNAVLLFSYPVKRESIFLAKLLLVAGFILTAFMVSSLLIGLMIMLAGPLNGSLLYHFGLAELFQYWSIGLGAAMIALAISALALLIGFLMNSVSATIVSAVIIISFATSTITGILATGLPAISLAIILSLLTLVAITGLLSQRIRKMEV